MDRAFQESLKQLNKFRVDREELKKDIKTNWWPAKIK
jgi:hypothetical protein